MFLFHSGVIRERASADLFTIDIKGNAKNSKKLSNSARKTLKADEIIAQRSAVPSVSLRKRPSDKTTDGLVPVKRQRTEWVSQKELARLRKVADGQHEITIDTKDADYDMWGAAAPQKLLKSKDDEFLPEEVKAVTAKAPKSMKQQPISLLAGGKKAAAVQKPTGGYSYNPTFTDYESRLTAEGQKALEAEQERLEMEEKARLKREAAARSAAEAEAAEARADLSEWEEDSEWEGFQSGAEEDKPSAKRPQRKTQAQRNRIKRRKEDERLAKHKAAMKARRIQEQRIKEIAQEVQDRDSNRALVLAEQRDASETESEINDDQKLRRKQLGKFKLPQNDLELVLPDELQDSLRRLKPEGNLLKDRYRSMLVRGKVEARRHLPFRRQAKRKMTEKWTFKDFVL
jgi:nucleolar protein 53